MHDIKFIRDNFETFKKKIANRNNSTKIDNILLIDKKNRTSTKGVFNKNSDYRKRA